MNAKIALVGKTNSGKSTFINKFCEDSVSIVTARRNTTKDLISCKIENNGNTIFLFDTAGLQHKRTVKSKKMSASYTIALNEADYVFYFISLNEKIRSIDHETISDILTTFKEREVYIILTKTDLIKKNEIVPIIGSLNQKYKLTNFFPISVLKNDNLNVLKNNMWKISFQKSKYSSIEEHLWNRDLLFQIKEITRKQIILFTHKEIPEIITIDVHVVNKASSSMVLHLTLTVNKESQKKIIIGSQGSKIKQIMSATRKELENIVSKKIFIESFVKIKKTKH